MDAIQFHRIGLLTEQPHPGERHYPSMKLWATSPDANSNRAEWIRFAPGSHQEAIKREIEYGSGKRIQEHAAGFAIW